MSWPAIDGKRQLALARIGEEDDAVAPPIKTKAKITGDDAPIYLFATAPPWACFHGIGRRDLRGLRHRAIDGTPFAGPFKNRGRNHGSQDR